MGLQPRTARVVKDGREEDILIADLQVGDKVSVRPGEQIPVDGVIVGGNTFIDESMISGEPIPVEKKQGDKVLAGTINQNGAFIMTAQKVGKIRCWHRLSAWCRKHRGLKLRSSVLWIK